MFLRNLCAMGVAVSLSQASFAANHQHVTKFEEIETQLHLTPGQTFLTFMRNEVKPGLDAYQETIQNDPASISHNYRDLQKHLIAQGAGVAIRIDASNYIFNIGYLDGSDPENDVKSGRSYAVGPTGTESDPSDVAYLRELEAYLQSEPRAVGAFVEALMLVLTNCDSSGWANLSEQGQQVASDFLAIYTAELDRHLMVHLNPRKHPWEIDLAAATFVSIFNTASGLIMQDGALVEGSIELWWAQGAQGSGIGNTRRDRMALQKLIADFEKDTDAAQELSQMIDGRRGNDVIQGVLEYLSSDAAPEAMADGTSDSFTRLMKKYLLHVLAKTPEIVEQGR